MKLSFIKCILIFILIFLIIQSTRYKPTIQEEIDENIIYINDFLSDEDYQEVLKLDKDLSNFIFENFRYSKPLSNNRNINDIFYHKKYIHKINKYIHKTIYPSEFPIEHRFYLHDSPGMKWHRDLLMYELPQYEAIFTINNTTDSLTKWKDKSNKVFN